MIDWATVESGDVVEMPSGTLRIIRDVHRYNPPTKASGYRYDPARRTYCYFVILHCSWTKAAYTLYSVGEMNQMGWKHTGKKMSVESEFDDRLRADFGARFPAERNFSCCDVEGLA